MSAAPSVALGAITAECHTLVERYRELYDSRRVVFWQRMFPSTDE